eukprot:g2703.t1
MVHTPGGMVHADCVVMYNGTAAEVPAGCAAGSSLPKAGRNQQIYAMDVHAKSSAGAWTSLNASWTVPKLPTEDNGQIVYFWPGFKSQQPEMGYPVLQPVMQYGQNSGFKRTKSWQLQSWFVHGGAVTAPAIDLSPGDRVESFMQYDAKSSEWTISGKNTNTGESTVLTISKEKLGGYDFEWAMLVCETIKQNGQCSSLPADDAGLTFDSVSGDGAAVTWTERENLSDCAEKAATAGADTVKFSWSYGG